MIDFTDMDLSGNKVTGDMLKQDYNLNLNSRYHEKHSNELKSCSDGICEKIKKTSNTIWQILYQNVLNRK